MSKLSTRWHILPVIMLTLAIIACWGEQNLGILKPDVAVNFTLYGEVDNRWNMEVTPNNQYEIILKNSSQNYVLEETSIYILISTYTGDNKPIFMNVPVTFSKHEANLKFTMPSSFSVATLTIGSKTGEGSKSYGSFSVELHHLG